MFAVCWWLNELDKHVTRKLVDVLCSLCFRELFFLLQLLVEFPFGRVFYGAMRRYYIKSLITFMSLFYHTAHNPLHSTHSHPPTRTLNHAQRPLTKDEVNTVSIVEVTVQAKDVGVSEVRLDLDFPPQLVLDTSLLVLVYVYMYVCKYNTFCLALLCSGCGNGGGGAPWTTGF